MEDIKHFEFLAINSKEIVEKQVDSYRQQHSYAGTVIGAAALFIPFFLNSLDGTYLWIQLISVLPVLLFIWAILLMLSIFRTKPLDQAFGVKKYTELLDKPYQEILLHEIEANTNSYTLNTKITEKGNKSYTKGIQLITVGLLISIVLMMANKFIAIEKKPTKVQVVNNSQQY